jgi:cystathionine beta-lyase/cystathionine gamma-synthase
VIYPGLMTGESKRRADNYLKGGYGGLVGFELRSGKDAGRKFIDSLIQTKWPPTNPGRFSASPRPLGVKPVRPWSYD